MLMGLEKEKLLMCHSLIFKCFPVTLFKEQIDKMKKRNSMMIEKKRWH